MVKRNIIVALSLVLVASTLSGAAFATVTEKSDKTVPADARMMTLHAMMPMLSVASAGLKTALEKGETASVEKEAEKILAAIPALKKSKPHKNVKQRKIYLKLAAKLEETVTSTVSLAKKGDFAGAKTAFKKVEATCVACHVKFRD